MAKERAVAREKEREGGREGEREKKKKKMSGTYYATKCTRRYME